jgi:phosphate/sulfate permease
MELLTIVVGWILAGFIGALGALVLYRMYRNEINLNKLISEPDGDASLSRFQFLVFTFVIAMGYFLITLRNGGAFPEIPPTVLGLLGISATSYVVSKSIQVRKDANKAETEIEKMKVEHSGAATALTNGKAKPADEPVATH